MLPFRPLGVGASRCVFTSEAEPAAALTVAQVALPQEMQNFDEMVAGIRARGGAVDLALSTDSMRATVWCANAMPRRVDPPGESPKTPPVAPLFAVAFAAIVGAGIAAAQKFAV